MLERTHFSPGQNQVLLAEAMPVGGELNMVRSMRNMAGAWLVRFVIEHTDAKTWCHNRHRRLDRAKIVYDNRQRQNLMMTHA